MSEPKTDPKAAGSKGPPAKDAASKDGATKPPEPSKDAAGAKDAAASNGAEGDAAPQAKGRGKLLILAAAGVVAIAAIGGGAFYFISGSKQAPPAETAKAPQKSAAVEFGPVVFHDYPEQLVDLKTGACKAAFLKYQITVEIPEKDRPRLVEVQARILDRTQMYLRNQERQELVGKAGAEKLRDEMTTIINGAIAPARANSVLFKKFLLQ